MFELVNTSLPNGLIPGTHGFATVAMTRGLSDSLRVRLEGYCAYNHRTSAHDASYFRENPVNWFHVVTSQGEHVVGRVAASEFDYTGRTNRLARLFVFPAKEMPAIGGAQILRQETGRFLEPWQGEARWLESDVKLCGGLRLTPPSQTMETPTWSALFGAEGASLAQRLALQLEKNLDAGGRSIYFKTSSACDVDGMRLLSLFAELVDLLPVEKRARVAFSTYPVALPGGTVCHLRGVYDRDRIFDAASVSQTWIDCEKGRVTHPELLPEIEEVKAFEMERPGHDVGDRLSAIRSARSLLTSAGPARSGNSPFRGTFNQQSENVGTYSKPSKPDPFLTVLIVASVVVVVGMVVFLKNLLGSNTTKLQEVTLEISNSTTNVLAEINVSSKSDAVSVKSRVGVSDVKTNTVDKKSSEQKKCEGAMVEILEMEREKKRLEELRVQFLQATNVVWGTPDEKNRRDKSAFTPDAGCRVFYYMHGNNCLTNEVVAGFVRIRGTGSVKFQWKDDGSGRLDDPVLKDSVVVLWYAPKEKKVWIDLHPVQEPQKIFVNEQCSVDFQKLCLGNEPKIAKLIKKKFGKDIEYSVKATNGSRSQNFETSESKWSFDEMLYELFADLKKQNGKLQKKSEEYEKFITKEYEHACSETNKFPDVKTKEGKNASSEMKKADGKMSKLKGEVAALRESFEKAKKEKSEALEKVSFVVEVKKEEKL